MNMPNFKKYQGKLAFEVGEEEIEIKPKLKDIPKILSIMQGKMTEDKADKLSKLYLNLIKKSYPYKEDNDQFDSKEEWKDSLEGFLTQNFIEFMTEFNIAMGWADRADIQEQMGELTEAGKKS